MTFWMLIVSLFITFILIAQFKEGITNHRTNRRRLEKMSKVVALYRVSTHRQGRSGLGLDAQRSAVMAYIGDRHELVSEFVEVESGKATRRPQLDAAIHRARVTGSVLVIAKLDRLSRNASFLLALRDSGVRFIACDMPEATEMTVGIMAVVAQGERQAIASRTREALAAARARGRRLGNASTLVAGAGQVRAAERVVEIANEKARDLLVVIDDIKATGISSYSGIARELEARRIQTPRGGSVWRAMQVRRVLDRVAAVG